MATAVLEALAARFAPDFAVALRPHLFPLLAGLQAGKVLVPAGRPRSPWALFNEVRNLRRRRFEAALLFPRSQETALVAWLARVPVRLGTLEGRSFFLTGGFRESAKPRKVGKEPRRVPRYMGDFYADLARLVGVEVPDTRPRLAVLPGEEEEAGRILRALGIEPGEPFFLLNPGAAFGASKLWPPESMAAAGRSLFDALGMRGVVLSGPAPGEQELAREIAGKAGPGVLLPAAGDHLVRLGPLKALVREATLMVTTDSGPRHAAVAFRVPHVVVMGPTHPGFTAKHLEEARVLRKEVDCGPCHFKECPVPGHPCMRGIRPDQVVQAALDLLGGRSSPREVRKGP